MNKRHIDAALQIYKKKRIDLVIAVDGNSMLPLIQHGDRVKIITVETYNIGDVVVYKNKITVIHRILDISSISSVKKLYITKGDNNLARDPPLLARCIIGKVTCIYRNNKEFQIKNDIFQKALTLLSIYKEKFRSHIILKSVVNLCQKIVIWLWYIKVQITNIDGITKKRVNL